MFTSNPWADYITMLAPLIAGYYLIVGLKFYGRDLKARIAAKRRNMGSRVALHHQDFNVPDPPDIELNTITAHAKQDQSVAGKQDAEIHDDTDQPAAWQNEELFDQVEQLAAHLKEAIEEAHEKEYGKQDLILLLQMTLKEYPAMSAKPFQTAINNLIETECAKYGSIHLREQDTEAIWKQVG
ncbi:hypothetical protein [Dyadobacter frigoris]|uniref:Uncharacterized protein n=1 Tax=Dyadobacter frigoris TaxID=2576211 RepID=A0A4U6D1B1_9BACT|nr:hypothetical protein [Dyadobacter frigoris]TKT91010.1 hypothetical protein FDK13_18820 [Dyadobacter frigoris]GLU56202.1 hypothetical protein Dfri01_56630 [Dyadobacter frigoris]